MVPQKVNRSIVYTLGETIYSTVVILKAPDNKPEKHADSCFSEREIKPGLYNASEKHHEILAWHFKIHV